MKSPVIGYPTRIGNLLGCMRLSIGATKGGGIDTILGCFFCEKGKDDSGNFFVTSSGLGVILKRKQNE